ncbi:hypothetical protein B0A48_16331 [Cryoendolithus antarcticus]|uniref:Uncharacterized protein n=1 Tax=Cryoendolithus antarcticus TaxID=1507870 RepID=A0A1V8SFW8_9PEZI|nr:hypothetical protein B0A48_16331 [Cryoendolithus antarcticus]
MGADCSLPSHKYTQFYLPADCFRSCCPGSPGCDNHRSHGSRRSNYWYVERGGNGKDRYHDPFEYMDRMFARGGAMQMMMPGGWPGIGMQSPMSMGMNMGHGGMAGYASGCGNGPYGGGCGTPGGIMGPGPWPGGWKPSSEWTGRDYSLLGEILNEYSAREKGKGRLPWGPWSDMMTPPWCPPPSWAGSHPWTDPYSSSGRKPWEPPGSAEKDIDALLAARLRQMSAATDPLLQTQESAAAKSYAEQISQLHDMLFGSNAEQKQKQYLEKLSQNFRQMQSNGMMNDPGSLQAQIQQLQAQFAAALGGQSGPGAGPAGGGRDSLERDLRQMMAERAAANEMRRRGGNGLRGSRRPRGGFDAEDDDWGDEWDDDGGGGGGGRRGNRGGKTNGRPPPRRGPPRRPRPSPGPNNNTGTGANPFGADNTSSQNGGAFDRPFPATQNPNANPYPAAFESNPPFRSTMPNNSGYQQEPFYPSRPAGPSPPTPDRPLTPVPSADLPDEIRRPLSPMPMPMPRHGGPGNMGWGYNARVEEVSETARGMEGRLGMAMRLNTPPTYVSQEDVHGGGGESRPGTGARHVSFGDIAPIGRQEPGIGGVKEV